MTPFQPVREDGRAYWQVVYDWLVERIDSGDLKVDDVIFHKEVSDVLGEGVEWRQPTLKAADHLRATRHRSLESVRGVGYKLIAGIDQVKQGKRVKHRASRGLERARRHFLTVDRKMLDVDQSAKLDLTYAATAFLVNYAKETDERVAQVEDNLARLESTQIESTVQQKATEDEVARLRQRLDSLEQTTS